MPSSSARPSRRQVVAASVVMPTAWFTGACTLSGPGNESASDPPEADEDPDVAVLAAAVEVVERLLWLVDRVLSERAELADLLRPLRATHRRHAEVLGAAGGDDSSEPTADPTADPTGDPTGRRAPDSGSPLPRGRNQVLTTIAREQQRAADAHMRQVRRASSGQFARLLASISAAESQHVAVVQEAIR